MDKSELYSEKLMNLILDTIDEIIILEFRRVLFRS